MCQPGCSSVAVRKFLSQCLHLGSYLGYVMRQQQLGLLLGSVHDRLAPLPLATYEGLHVQEVRLPSPLELGGQGVHEPFAAMFLKGWEKVMQCTASPSHASINTNTDFPWCCSCAVAAVT